jgi:hypothetical protein
MNAQRILKEARPLLWPWCVVVVTAVLPLVQMLHSIAWISLVGFVLGIPILATLSVGNEFQHQTLSLLLSQPINRMDIWREKLAVTLVAVLLASLIFLLVGSGGRYQMEQHSLALAAAWIATIIASATFWTLFARSLVGGIVLNFGVPCFIVYTVDMASWLRKPSPTVPTNVSAVIIVCFLIYAGVMLWLSRRVLAGFQATDGMAGDDLLTGGPAVLPQAWAGWLRCRPTGAVLNLFRKEIRLLRPVWLISLLAALGWACVTLLRLRHQGIMSEVFPIVLVSMAAISTLMIALLAGSLSLGEEKTSGTDAWNMTLPVSAALQWRIKLFMALFAGFAGAWLLPVLLIYKLRGPSDTLMGMDLATVWLIAVLTLTFVSFWSACAENGMVRAVLWVLPVLVIIGLAGGLGARIGWELIDRLVLRFDPFAGSKFAGALISWFDISPGSGRYGFARYFLGHIWWESWYAPNILGILSIPTLILAVIQSNRRFHEQAQSTLQFAIRNLLPLAFVAFCCCLCWQALHTLVSQAFQQDWDVRMETSNTILKVESAAAALDAMRPLQLTGEDLEKSFPLSDRTRRWLRNSHITIVSLKRLPHRDSGTRLSGHTFMDMDDSHAWYLATIYLPGGSNCTQSFPRVSYPKKDFNMLFVICQ